MRTRRRGSGMFKLLGERQFHSRTRSWYRLDGQLGTGDSRAFLDDGRSDAALIEVASREPSFERKAAPIVLHDKPPMAIGGIQAHQDVARLRMPSHVGERLLYDADDFERRLRR